MDNWEEIERWAAGDEWIEWSTDGMGRWRVHTDRRPLGNVFVGKANARRFYTDLIQATVKRRAEQAEAAAQLFTDEENRAALAKHPFFGRF